MYTFILFNLRYCFFEIQKHTMKTNIGLFQNVSFLLLKRGIKVTWRNNFHILKSFITRKNRVKDSY